jgi:hypothetical protein
MEARGKAEQRVGIPRGLTGDLVDTLCLLDDAPPGVAEATIALLPYGSRANLATHGIIEAVPPRRQRDEAADIRITAYGQEVIAACARGTEDCPDPDEQPEVAGGSRRSAQFLAAWQPRAEAVDRQLTRVNRRARERFETTRRRHHTAH